MRSQQRPHGWLEQKPSIMESNAGQFVAKSDPGDCGCKKEIEWKVQSTNYDREFNYRSKLRLCVEFTVLIWPEKVVTDFGEHLYIKL